RRVRTRFENCDWHGIQADTKKRLAIYKRRVPRIARKIRRMMGESFDDTDRWLSIKAAYRALALARHAYEIAETYYNSVCRKVIDRIGADESIMFVEDEHHQREYADKAQIYRSHRFEGSFTDMLRALLVEHQHEVDYEDLDRDIAFLHRRLQEEVFPNFTPDSDTRLEVLRSVFYRNKAAYLVGRLFIAGQLMPFIIPMLNREGRGIFTDALILSQNEMSIIFSFTRSYFMVEVDIPSEWVHFLKTVIPLKPYGDLYNSIGYSKHGKTELYRHFRRHINKSTDQFTFAPGIKGMVMSVFTLPSYNVVFKLIKDNFDPPKTTNKAHVRSCYKLVSVHDRVGRMADTHEFEHFVFPKDRFDPALLEELLRVAGSIVRIKGDSVIIDHLYTERKMVPLNIFLETATPNQAEAVIEEYGNTIKQLAAANIFPGDMLLKNFGVTRHRRVVFYDYDEIGFLTDYKFRRLPDTSEDEDAYAGSPWFAVGPNDVFPEEFKHFLVGREDIREIFFQQHRDLFEPRFWIDIQRRLAQGEVVDVFPYRRRKRFRNI
ncbi:MAG: bifunctional isocitrate dehydrogenase kinase/phosphatase, partial [Bacteroidota bacterium]